MSAKNSKSMPIIMEKITGTMDANGELVFIDSKVYRKPLNKKKM
jgi:hypothetical protein